ncbi:subtilase-type protease inhibitor [Streptomyces sp. NPDC050617]|uniref:subtilase-type protease inhibitor n=1 Tax=Streptomyces sp. NPDC050617 TaxID=3154628 RepID=UPI0034273565
MRYITGGIALAAALAVTGLAGASTIASAAPVQPKSLYAPSALVLTVGEGEHAANTTVRRAVTLSCTPTASGTHPAAKAACAELTAAGGKFDVLAEPASDRACPHVWNPVVVTVDGVWEGARVSYEHTFANACTKENALSTVYEF